MPPFAPTSWGQLWSALPLRTRVIVISLGVVLAGFGLWLGTRPARKWADPVDPQLLSLTDPKQAALVEQASLSPSRSLPNGTIIRSPESAGKGILRIENGTVRDAVVKLVDERLRKTMLTVYVQAGQSVSVPDLPEGLFRAVFATGWDWDPEKGSFTKEKAFARFEGELDFHVKHRAEGVREYGDYAVCSLALPAAMDGNPAIARIWEDQFQSY